MPSTLSTLHAGEAFRAVCGLGIGYLSRPFFKVEQLLWPVYNAALQALVPNATYEVGGTYMRVAFPTVLPHEHSNCQVLHWGQLHPAGRLIPEPVLATVVCETPYFFRLEMVYYVTLLLHPPQVSPSSRADTQTTLNQLGIAIAASFFIPQYVLHWDYAQSTQFSVPLAMGWFMFDVCYMFALLFKLRMI